MRFHYLDAENIGLAALEGLQATLSDRVFLFANPTLLMGGCNNALVTVISDYPQGPNQADFRIIGHLANVLAHIPKAQRKAVEFCLYTRDQWLWKAFECQCSTVGIKAVAPLIDEPASVSVTVVESKPDTTAKMPAPPTSPPAADPIQQRILRLMEEPIKSRQLQIMLNLPQSKFTSHFQKLITDGIVVRVSNSSKYWVKARTA